MILQCILFYSLTICFESFVYYRMYLEKGKHCARNCYELETLLGRQAVQLQKAINEKCTGMLTHKVMETKTTVGRVSSSLSYRHQKVPIETNGDFVSTAHHIDSTNDKVQIHDAELSLDFKQDSEGRRQRM